MTPRTLPLVLVALALPLSARALPDVGGELPDVQAKDVTGETQQLQDLLGERTLIVAITDRNAAEEMRAWFDTADRRAPEAERVSILSLDLPFFAPTGIARDRAREQIPEPYWNESLLDRGELAEELGLEGSGEPYVLVTDGEGRVLARYHGQVGEEGAGRIWDALGR